MTPIWEIIFSGFVSKAVNDIVDISKDKIKRAVKSKNVNYQSIESQIYNVIVDVLNKTTRNQYEDNQDKIFDVAYVLLKSFKKNEIDELGNIKSCLQILGLNADEDECLTFKVSLYEQLGIDEYGELFRVILLLLLDQKSKYDNAVYAQLNQKLDEVNLKISELDQKLDNMQKNQADIIIQDRIVKFQNNKKQDYIKNWNSRLFLHMDNDEKPITLADAFIMPDYHQYKPFKSPGVCDDTLDKIIDGFLNFNNKTKTMLITGVPGIGKSTITSWIANKYKENDKLIILRFRDLEAEDLEKGLLNTIYKTLNCNMTHLNSKILILDGFDEMKLLNSRKRLLTAFFNDILDLKYIKCIITSRPTYISSMQFDYYIKLDPFNCEKINKFYKIVTGRTLKGKVDYNNIDVYGIPVILYMAIMSNINIAKNTTKPQLYSLIFAERGGIFDRFSYKGVAYSEGSHILRDHDNIEKYLQFLQKVAFAMFEKSHLTLCPNEYEISKLEFQGKSISVLEFPIKYLFENAETNIEFIHMSIYEFFVSEFVYKSIYEALDMPYEDLARILGETLQGKVLSLEIIEFLKHKFKSITKLHDKFERLLKTFNIMMRDGMTYYTKRRLRSVMDRERIVFTNMLYILHFWKNEDMFVNIESISYYLQNINCEDINLNNLYLGGADLRGVNFRGAQLERTFLRKADLRGANLNHANLRRADLSGADLRRTNLSDTHLQESIWYDSDIRKVLPQLKEADFKTLLILDGDRIKEVYRSELFSYENKSSNV